MRSIRSDRSRAVKLHRQMWLDMMLDLGDDASPEKRIRYKLDWCRRNFPDEDIAHNCFLCECAEKLYTSSQNCIYCPIDWSPLVAYKGGLHRCYVSYIGGGREGQIFLDAPISEILELPERETGWKN